MAFNERLRLLREERGLSQQDLGNVLSLSKANVSKFETGKLQPSLQHLITLIQYFTVSGEFLLGISDERKGTQPQQTPAILSTVKPDLPTPVIPPEEYDPFKKQLYTILNSEYTEIEKDILSRCLTYGLKQIAAIRNERMGLRN